MRIALSFGLAVLLFACGSPQPSADLQGVLSLNVAYQQPPPDAPRSIGGYAALAHLTAPDGSVLFSGEIDPLNNLEQPRAMPPTFELPAGDYQLEVKVLSASDAISVDQNGNVHRDLGPVTSTCSATIRVEPPTVAGVVVTLNGGASCSISLAE